MAVQRPVLSFAAPGRYGELMGRRFAAVNPPTSDARYFWCTAPPLTFTGAGLKRAGAAVALALRMDRLR
jgi:hypothetical protein